MTRYDIRPIVGIEQPTAQSALRDGDKVKLLRPRSGRTTWRATAPCRARRRRRASSSGSRTRSTRSERHASLQNDGDVLFQLNGILTQPSFNPGDYRDATAKIGQSLDVEDWLTPTSRSRCARGRTPTPAGCSSRSPRTPRRVRRRRASSSSAADEGWYAATLGPLPEGVYRVTSLGGSVEPVTDLVTVVGE